MSKITELKKSMIEYYNSDPKRIHHFLKVHSLAKLIGEQEGIDEKTQFILESAALVHDIGIKPAEEKYGRCSGSLQEKEGPAPAEKMLKVLDYEQSDIDRICFLVAHHHTYEKIDNVDYQILVEADFLVNLYEDSVSFDGIKKAYDSIFKSNSGKNICRVMFGL